MDRREAGASVTLPLLTLLCFAAPGLAAESARDYPIDPISFTQTEIADGFWAPRLDTNRKVTIEHNIESCRRTGRIQNFAVAGGLAQGKFEGRFGFDDSDVYKVIEGASYSLRLRPDPQLDHEIDEIVAKIAAAQKPDGYLYTAGEIPEMAEEPICCVSKPRWADIRMGHELYNAGHLFEAAVAHVQGTGKHTLLDIATRYADLLTRVFGPGKNMMVPGHEEVEIGLVKLYRVTGKEEYLRLARFFLDQRGNAKGHALYGPYHQDHAPVIEQSTAVGHAVRAAYLYTGMADVAALTGAEGYVAAIDRIWGDVVTSKLYVTGGIGATHEGESLGDHYELPNRMAYAETCAAIANTMWNQRLFRLHGDAKYVDVIERTAYNAILSSVALSGNQFFYVNPLASDGKYAFNADNSTGRRPWFACSCCPPNLARFLATFGEYVYARRDRDVYVNLFVAGSTRLELDGQKVRLRQTTEYPWQGEVTVAVEPEREVEFTLHVRVPGWAREQPVPSDLYRYADGAGRPYTVSVNGQPQKVELEKGYAVLRRKWKAGDSVRLSLPMPVRRVLSNDRVAANAGRVALERGPIVYAMESVDNGGSVFNVVLPDDAQLSAERRPELLGGVTVITGKALAMHASEDGRSVVTREHAFTAIPYNVWSHRGEDQMEVWIPRRVNLDLRIP
jgi:DUF1680 family protein